MIVGFSIFIAILIIIWSRQPEYRPLVQDLRLADSVRIADVLDQKSLRYYADIKSHMLYVDTKQIIDAKIALAKTGIVIDYPNIKVSEDLREAFEQLELQLERKNTNAPIYQQEWFPPLFKLITSMLVVMVLTLSIIRPALRALIYPNEDK
jgi:flagellar biosynthesis/type III secretory pathway M-ring protein FliF/YscJ